MENSPIDNDTYQKACEIDRSLALKLKVAMEYSFVDYDQAKWVPVWCDQLRTTMDNKEQTHQELWYYINKVVNKRGRPDWW